MPDGAEWSSPRARGKQGPCRSIWAISFLWGNRYVPYLRLHLGVGLRDFIVEMKGLELSIWFVNVLGEMLAHNHITPDRGRGSMFWVCCSVAKLCPTLCDPWTEVCQAPISSTTSQSLLKFMSIESVMLPPHLTLCHPLFLCLQSFPASFPVSQLSAWVAKVFDLQLSAAVLPVNIQGWFPLGLNGLIS